MESELSVGSIVSLQEFLPLRKQISKLGKKLVWTNGCFDILHAGHTSYLEKAKSIGDYLIIGINSDASYQIWKKRPGPVNPQNYRAQVLLALSAVDYVMIFDESSPLKNLEQLKPDFYVKGDDYNIETIDQQERAILDKMGCEIRFCSGYKGISTTEIIERILTIYR